MHTTANSWYLDPLILAPLFGLVGVLVGGLISAGSTYWVEYFRDQRAQVSEQTARANQLYVAARLVDADFRLAWALASTSLEANRWDKPARALGLDNWQKYQHVLAAALSHEDWMDIVVAAEAVGMLKLRHEAALSGQDASGDFDKSTRDQIEDLIHFISRAETLLVPLAGGQNDEEVPANTA